MAGVFVPSKKKIERGFTLPFCWGSYESNLVQGEKDGKRERYRKREVVKKTEGERGRKAETEREKERERGREIHSVWPRVRGTVGV